MTAATLQQVANACESFREVRCCDKLIGVANTRPFTAIAAARYEDIRARHITEDDPFGNAFVDDPDWIELQADPDACGPPEDGTPVCFGCTTCGARFAFVGGEPVRVEQS